MNELSRDDSIIECRGVTKRFGDVQVLEHVDLVVRRGEFVAVSGGSGSGKSTLLHLLAALDRPTAGEIWVNEHDLARMLAPNRFRRSEIGLVFQMHNLLPRLSASENVQLAMFGTGRRGRERRARSLELLEQLGMGQLAHRTPPRLSGGERQRVAIARALANNPDILLADEPTGNLDPAASAQFLDLVRGLRESAGLTVVIVTHDQAVAAGADRRVRMVHGRLESA